MKTMTAAAALAVYDAATTPHAVAEAAAAMAGVLRGRLPKAKAAAGYDMTAAGLTRALRLLGKVIERRNTIPILSNVLIEAAGDRLLLTGTDMDILLALEVPAPGVGDWTTTAPHAALLAALSKASGDVTLALFTENDGDKLKVEAGGASWQFPCLPPADFPAMEVKGKAELRCKVADLDSMLAFVQPCISTEETRYYLNGAFLKATKESLLCVATDGHRLAQATLPVASVTSKGLDGGFILPRKAVAVLRTVMAGQTEVTMQGGVADEPRVEWAVPGARLSTRLIDGSFPDYERVIPRDCSSMVTVNRLELAGAIERASSISNDRAPKVRLTVDGDKLSIGSKNLDMGAASESVPCAAKVVKPKPVERWPGEVSERHFMDAYQPAGFNASYLITALQSLEGETVTIHGEDNSAPFRLEGERDDRLIVLMPLRL